MLILRAMTGCGFDGKLFGVIKNAENAIDLIAKVKRYGIFITRPMSILGLLTFLRLKIAVFIAWPVIVVYMDYRH